MKKCEKVHTKSLFQANWLIQALSGFIICWLQRNIERSGSGLTAVFNCLLVCQISSQSSYLFAVASLGNQEISWAGLLYSIRLLEPSQHSTLIKSLPAPFLQCSNYILLKKNDFLTITFSDMSMPAMRVEVLVAFVCAEGESFFGYALLLWFLTWVRNYKPKGCLGWDQFNFCEWQLI